MKKNVLLLISQLHGGGAEKALANLSIYLSEYFNITLAIYNNTHLSANSYKGELIKINLPYHEKPENNSFHKRLLRFLFLIHRLRKIKKEKSIDVSISFLEASNFVNILSARREKIILSVRSFLSHELKDDRRLRIFKYLIRLLYKRAHHIVVPASLVKTDLHENFGIPTKQISVIYNFIDKTVIDNLSDAPIPDYQEEIFKHSPILINVGRFSNPKAQWLLVHLLAKIKPSLPGARLLILGDGKLRQRLLETARLEKLKVYEEGVSPTTDIDGSDIFLLGYTKNPYPYMKRSTLFIMSSVYEGFPNVMIEAMACSLPVISSDCFSGPREILSPLSDQLTSAQTAEFAEYGILTPVFERETQNAEKYVNETANAILNLLEDENYNRYKAQSLKRVKSFQKENAIPKWMELIQNTD